MRAFFDISCIAAGSSDVRSRTGVFTYARNLALQFQKDDEIGFSLLQGGAACFGRICCGEEDRILAAKALPGADGAFVRAVSRSGAVRFSLVRSRIDRWYAAREPSAGGGVLHQPFFGKWPEWAGRGTKWTKCLTVHDLIAWRYPEWFDVKVLGYRERWSRWIRQSDFLICDSEATRSDLLEFFPEISIERTAVVLLGPSFLTVAGNRREEDEVLLPSVLSGRSYLLSVCTIEPRKNLKRVLDAFERFKEESGSECLLALVGGGGWVESLPELLGGMKRFAGDVVATGYIADELLPVLYRQACAFVYPSLYEGFGLPVLDALAMGVPVVTSNTSSLPEIAGSAALMVDPLNVDDIADALFRVTSDEVLRKRLAQEGMQRARHFSWERSASETKAVYMNCG